MLLFVLLFSPSILFSSININNPLTSLPQSAYFTDAQSDSVRSDNVQAQHQENIEPAQPAKKPFVYHPHTFGFNARFGFADRFNVHEHSAAFLNMYVFDFYIGKRLGKTSYIPLYLQLRFSYGGGEPEYPVYEEFRYGILIGAAQYVFDYRNHHGIGWSMLASGGLAIDLPTVQRIKSNPAVSAAALAVELDFKTAYNLTKDYALTFGISGAYAFSYSFRDSVVYDDEGFAAPVPKGLYLENTLLFALSVGILI